MNKITPRLNKSIGNVPQTAIQGNVDQISRHASKSILKIYNHSCQNHRIKERTTGTTQTMAWNQKSNTDTNENRFPFSKITVNTDHSIRFYIRLLLLKNQEEKRRHVEPSTMFALFARTFGRCWTSRTFSNEKQQKVKDKEELAIGWLT